MANVQKKQWKEIKLEGAVLADGGGLEGLLGIEELTDYDVGTVGKAKRKKFNSSSKVEIIKNKAKSVKKEKRKICTNGNVPIENMPKKRKVVTENGFTVEDLDMPAKPNTMFSMKLDKVVNKLKRTEIGMINQDQTETLEDVGDSCMQENKPVVTMDDMYAWNGLGLPEEVMKALLDQGFKTPTPIQALTLAPAILGRRDILGAAETGSGKTLAFGIPIINGILNLKDKLSIDTVDIVNASTSKACDTYSDGSAEEFINTEGESDTETEEDDSGVEDGGSVTNEEDNEHDVFVSDISVKSTKSSSIKPLYALVLTPTRELAIQVKNHLIAAAKYTGIRIAVVVGGMASVKQERLLAYGPEIVVATPGRLWELIQQGNPHLSQIDDIRFLAIDETDRMVERGHFAELQQLLERINSDEDKVKARQNFVFSATLTLVHDLPKHLSGRKKKHGAKILKQTPGQKLQSVIEMLGITNPKTVDLTKETGTAGSLTECRIACAIEHKDYYLYYFLQRHPGRTIVFCNSIGCVKRLAQLFSILGCTPLPLHASMAQRQRLKNLERFRDDPNAVLVATDVAARGLDIPDVQHVIHYQVPRTCENYVHRSGRTARVQKEGLTILLMEPTEVRNYTKLCRTLGRTEDLPLFPVADSYLVSVKQRVNLARKLDTMELQARRSQAQTGWFQKAAEEMDIMLDEDDVPVNMSAEETSQYKRTSSDMRKQLAAMLNKPLFPKGFSCKYPTSSGMLEIPLVQGDQSKEDAVQIMKNAIENYKRSKNKNTFKLLKTKK